MPRFAETAYAKINLALHIRGRRADGYHEIETLFAFVDCGDALTASAADSLELTVAGPFAGGLEGQDNLILQAARLLSHIHGVEGGARMTLTKNLPVSSGIGGGSADAAAAARLLNRLWGLEASNSELAAALAPLGADIPACVESLTVIGTGTGTELRSIEGSQISGMPVLLVNPLVPVSTASIFGQWDGVDRGGLASGSAIDGTLGGRNDLQPPAVIICPAINEILEVLETTNPLIARMSGSGATCYALYDSIEARDAARTAMGPQWWTMAGLLR